MLVLHWCSPQFLLEGRGGVASLLYSLVLSRGVANIREDMQASKTNLPLIVTAAAGPGGQPAGRRGGQNHSVQRRNLAVISYFIRKQSKVYDKSDNILHNSQQ